MPTAVMTHARRETLLKLHQPDFGPAEEEAVLAVLRSGWLTKGPRTSQFEQAFAAYVESAQALGLNSATAALHTALLAAGIGPGDEVIVPALTFAATANVVLHCGATPVFADVLWDSHCIDPWSVANLVTERTKAIIPVHFAGHPCELGGLWSLAARHGLFILEDCAHAIETQFKGRPVGACQRADAPGGGSRFAAYSFYATKNLICGEGGMLTCQTEADLERSRVISLHGMSSNAWKRYSGERFSLYDIIEPGFKYNMFELQAALGLVQLEKLERNWEKRRALCAYYDGLLAETFAEAEVIPLRPPGYGRSAHHLYIVRVARELQRDRVIEELLARNVQTYVHYIALTGTQLYRERLGTRLEDTPVSAQAGARSITLPLYPSMTQGDVDYVVAMLKESLEAARG